MSPLLNLEIAAIHARPCHLEGKTQCVIQYSSSMRRCLTAANLLKRHARVRVRILQVLANLTRLISGLNTRYSKLSCFISMLQLDCFSCLHCLSDLHIACANSFGKESQCLDLEVTVQATCHDIILEDIEPCVSAAANAHLFKFACVLYRALTLWLAEHCYAAVTLRRDSAKF